VFFKGGILKWYFLLTKKSMTENSQEKKISSQEKTPDKKPHITSSKKSMYWVIGLVALVVILGLFYKFVYTKLPTVQDSDMFEPSIYTQQEQQEILKSLSQSAPLLTAEERSTAIKTFFGVSN